MERKMVVDRFSQSHPGEVHITSQRKQTVTTLAELHVCWQEQFRHALNFQEAGFDRAAQEEEQTARDEVHVAVAQATEISWAEMGK